MAFDMARDHRRPHRARWTTGFLAKIRIIHALMMRQAVSRYGHENLGFFWIIGEPLVFTVAIMILWSVAHLTHGGEVDVIPFALTGYSFITMWRHIVARSNGSLKQSASLRYHRQVNPIDALIAMGILEILACFTSFSVAYLPLLLLGYCPLMSDPLNLVGGFFLTGLFSLGFGLLMAALSQSSEALHHITPAVMYITMPLTGIFTMQAWLPQSTRDFLSWSPLVNGAEMFRAGLFPSSVPTIFDVKYLMISTAVVLVVGYWAFQWVQDTVEG